MEELWTIYVFNGFMLNLKHIFGISLLLFHVAYTICSDYGITDKSPIS